MQTLERNIIQTWIDHHKIQNIDIEGDFSWVLNRPTIKYINKYDMNLNIPCGKIYVPLKENDIVSQKLIKKQSKINVKFLISMKDEAGDQKFKVISSQNHIKLYIVYDDIFVKSEDICWFDMLPKQCRIMAYYFEKNGIESESFLLNRFFKKKSFTPKSTLDFFKISKTKTQTSTIASMERHIEDLSDLVKKVRKMNQELKKIIKS